MCRCLLFFLLLPLASQAAEESKLRLMIPMYFYPHAGDAQWQAVANAGARVDAVAIINPGNGLQDPLGAGEYENYNEGQKLLHNAGVKMIGYVSSNYGCESLREVKEHVDQYFEDFEYVTGIFVDETENKLVSDDDTPLCPETAAGFSYADYYAAISDHVRGYARFDMVVFNPGTDAPSEYLAMADVLVSYESRAENFEDDVTGEEQLSSEKPESHALMIHGTGPLSHAEVARLVDLAVLRNYGYLYFTDDDSWSKLPTYFDELVSLAGCRNPDRHGSCWEAPPPYGNGGGSVGLWFATLLLFRPRRSKAFFNHREPGRDMRSSQFPATLQQDWLRRPG